MNSQPVLLCPEPSQFFLVLLNLPLIRNKSHSSLQAFGFTESSTRLSVVPLTTVLAWAKAWAGWRIQLRVFMKLSRVTQLSSLSYKILEIWFSQSHDFRLRWMPKTPHRLIQLCSPDTQCLPYARKRKASFTKARTLQNLRDVSL